MSHVLVLIPTLTGREEYLANCMRGYRTRSGGHEIHLSVVRDAPTCGIGWQRCIDQAFSQPRRPRFEYIHFGNDDTVVGEGWLPPLIEAVEHGRIPASRVEPAGVHLGHPMPSPIPMPPAGDPTSQYGYFYSDHLENQPKLDWQEVDHGGAPFCSVTQWWNDLGPMIPIHFGTDLWFYLRARQRGYRVVARQRSIIYNYAAPIGRSRGEWAEIDILDYDLTVAYPMYVSGELDPNDEPPDRLAPEGLRRVREWRERSFRGPHHWEGQ